MKISFAMFSTDVFVLQNFTILGYRTCGSFSLTCVFTEYMKYRLDLQKKKKQQSTIAIDKRLDTAVDVM